MPRPRKSVAQPAEQPAGAPAAAPIVLDIRIHLDGMTVADLPLVHRMRRGEALDHEVVELFDRVVEGGSGSIPLPALGEACRALYAAIFRAADPETPQGN